MVMGKLPVPGRLSNLDNSMAGAYCACGRGGWGLWGYLDIFHFFSFVYHFSPLSGRPKYCLVGCVCVCGGGGALNSK